jgi:SAM-dependent methyltransferase
LLPPHPARRVGDLQGKTKILSYHRELDLFVQNTHGPVLDLGSGGRRINEKTVSFDLFHERSVDVIGDGQELPFKDGTFNGIIIQQVLQLVPFPDRILSESRRILNGQGKVYIEVPFLYPRHESRADYWRWTQDGLKLFANKYFSDLKTGVSMGGGSAISSLLRWAARVSMTGGERQANDGLWWASWTFIGWLTFWIKYLDEFTRTNTMADMVAAHVFYIGKKE